MTDDPFERLFRRRASALKEIAEVDNELERILAGAGLRLSIGAVRILHLLDRNGHMTRSDLNMDTATTYRLRELERLGLVETRKGDRKDGRRIGVGITKAGAIAWTGIEVAREKMKRGQ